jgi:hypothetical protein
MGTTSNLLSLRTWPERLVAVAAAELIWFGLLHPLVPRTLHAALVLALLPIAIVAYVYFVLGLLARLRDSPWNLFLRQLLGLFLVLSVGGAIFGLLYVAESHLQGELGYFWFRSH